MHNKKRYHKKNIAYIFLAEDMSNSSASPKVEQEDADSLEENFSSEEWTIIDKKDESDDNIEKKIEGPKETVVSEEACDVTYFQIPIILFFFVCFILKYLLFTQRCAFFCYIILSF